MLLLHVTIFCFIEIELHYSKILFVFLGDEVFYYYFSERTKVNIMGKVG